MNDPRAMPTVWQGAQPHGGERIHLPTGPFVRDAGCVISTGKLLRDWLRPDLLSMTVLEVLRLLQTTPGALVDGQGHTGALVYWPVATPALGLACDDAVAHVPDHVDAQHEFGGHTVDPNADLAAELAGALTTGGAAVRVDVDGDERGDHTIACFARTDDGLFLCSCPALCSIVTLDANLENASIKWNGRPHPYRAVGIRAVRRAA